MMAGMSKRLSVCVCRTRQQCNGADDDRYCEEKEGGKCKQAMGERKGRGRGEVDCGGDNDDGMVVLMVCLWSTLHRVLLLLGNYM